MSVLGTDKFVELVPVAPLEPPLGFLLAKEGKWDRLGMDEGELDREE
jgi:hypothetical protein